MLSRYQNVYTWILCLGAMLLVVGCGSPQNTGSSSGDASEANQASTDPVIPTVTVPDEDAEISDSPSANDSTEQ
jgi:hypothetical protein